MAAPSRPHATAAPGANADDTALLDRARNGDRQAFAALVRRHSGALLRFASTLLRERSLAEEVVQDTWLAALEGLAGFEGRSSLRTWLFRVLANKART